MHVDIKGLPHNPTINGIDFSGFSAEEHKRFIANNAPHNYHQIPGWIVEGLGPNNWSLLLRRTRDEKEELKDVLDFQTMYSTLNAGVRNESIIKTMVEFLSSGYLPAIPRAMDHLFLAAAIEAGKRFTGMDSMIMKSGGAEAVETACNIASRFWHSENQTGQPRDIVKLIFIAARGNFHGRTRFPRSLSDSVSSRDGFGPLLPNVHHVRFGDSNDLEATLSLFRGRVIAVILEPIQGEAGVIIPPENYLPRVSELCQRYETLLILDEIQTGFGRTGTDFVYERYGIQPDLVCLGKALGGGFVPVSCVAGRSDVMNCLEPGTEGATWSGTPIQCIALMAAIKELCDNKLSSQSAEKGNYLLTLFNGLAEKYPGVITNVRGKGLFVGVDTIYDGQELSLALLEEGMWAKETGKNGKTIRLSPPLIIPKEELKHAVLIFERALLRLKQ